MITFSSLRFHGDGLFSIIQKKVLMKKNSKLKMVPKILPALVIITSLVRAVYPLKNPSTACPTYTSVLETS